ncbi:MAG: hypothetical protein ACM3KE_12910 [Hyphomicrobiales bacterium]
MFNMILLAVFAVSFSALAFEVLLARIFSITQWHHLSFMVVSIAMFGFGASGSVLSLSDRIRSGMTAERSLHRAVPLLCILFPASLLLAFAGLNRLPMDYFRLLYEPIQAIYLLLAYLLLVLPFLFAGGVVSIAYMLYQHRPGWIYFASMTGSALGAGAPAVLLPVAGEVGVLALTAWAPLVVLGFGLPSYLRREPRRDRRDTAFVLLVVVSAVACTALTGLMTFRGGKPIHWRMSEYKYRSQVLSFPDTRIDASVSDIRGLIDTVQGPHLRYAPGLSLKYTEPLPPVKAVLTDGDQPFFLYDTRVAKDLRFAAATLSFSGYEFAARVGRVLVIEGGGGGLAIPCALAADAGSILVVQRDPHLAEITRRHYSLEVITANPRSYLAQTRGVFDVIHIESWGATVPGAGALQQDHLLTVEALAAYFRHLDPGGVMIISRRLLLPPSDSLRLWATAREALARIGQASPEQCLAVLRNYDTFTLVAARQPLRDHSRILEYARHWNFDVIYLAGAGESEANRFSVFDAPFHFREIRQLEEAFQEGRPQDFFSAYLLDVEPRDDLRPFPGRFIKWLRVGDLYRAVGSRLHVLFLSGEMVVALVFFEALLVAALLLLVPAAAVSRKDPAATRASTLYFWGIGTGFIFGELLLVHAGTFFLGDPVVSLALVLTVLLASSGLGGLWAHRHGPGAIKPALLASGLSLMAAASGLWIFAHQVLALDEPWRYAVLSLVVILPGLAMGVPFPLGMRFLMQRSVDRAFAWAVNGCASVLGAIATAQIAISAGFEWILAAAVISYGLAFFGVRRKRFFCS